VELAVITQGYLASQPLGHGTLDPSGNLQTVLRRVARMADTPQMTTDQYNFCRAVEAMRLELLRSGKAPAWLVAHPGVLALALFYLPHCMPDGA
jgi:hypothetical protein